MNQVTLTQEEWQHVLTIADRIEEDNRAKADNPDFDPNRTTLTPKQLWRLGKLAEAMAFKWLGGDVLNHTLDEWAHYVPADHPDYDRLVHENHDLFNAYEIRRTERRDNTIPVRAKDAGGMVLQVYIPYGQPLPTAENPKPNIFLKEGYTGYITGWAKAEDEGKVPVWARKPGTKVVPPRPMDTFKAVH